MKNLHLLFLMLALMCSERAVSQSEIQRSFDSFKGVVLKDLDEVELLNGSDNKVILNFSGIKEKIIVSEIIEGSLVIGYKNDKKPEGASLKAKIYCSGPINTVSAKASKVFVKDISVGSNLNLIAAGKSFLEMKAKVDKAKVAVSSSSKIKLQIEAVTVDAKVNSKGSLEIGGSTDTFNANSGGSGKLMGYGLMSKTLKASAHSSGRLEAFVSESLVANAVSGGKIYYKGNPKNKKMNGTSSGKIEKAP